MMTCAYIFPFTTYVWTSTQYDNKPRLLSCHEEIREVLLSSEIIGQWLRLMNIPRHVSDIHNNINTAYLATKNNLHFISKADQCHLKAVDGNLHDQTTVHATHNLR